MTKEELTDMGTEQRLENDRRAPKPVKAIPTR